jgi:hypothetical protein
MKTLSNRKILLALVFLICAGILVFLAFRFFILVREGKRSPQLPADRTNASQKPWVIVPNTETQAVSADNLALPTISYRDHHFTPVITSLKLNASGTGCVIKIVNESDTPLVVRLSPHEKALKGNYGGQYDPIPPGKFIIIDPRFDMGEESFHNFKIPNEEFHLRIGNSCRSDL